MTTTLLLACLLACPFACPLAAGPQSSLVGARASFPGTGHGLAPLATDPPAQDAPPAPGDAKPQGQADIPLPAALKEASTKVQASLDTAEAAYKKQVSAAMDPYVAALKREYNKAVDAGKVEVATLLDQEVVKSFQERDALVGGNSATAYQLELLKNVKETLNKQFDKAVAAEDLKRINELDAEIKRTDARIEELTQEAAATPAGDHAASAQTVASRIRRQLENSVFWLASDHGSYMFCLGKNGKWLDRENSSPGTWSVDEAGTISLFPNYNTKQPYWTLTLSGNRITGYRANYNPPKEFRGRMVCSLSEAAAKGLIPSASLSSLGLSSPAGTGAAELPLVVTAARTTATRAIDSARNSRGVAVSAPIKQYLQTLSQERQKPGLDDEAASQIDRELARVRRLSDSLTGSQMVLEEERRELQEVRRTALKNKDTDLANTVDAKIKQLESILQENRPAEQAANRFRDAVIFLATARSQSYGSGMPDTTMYVLDTGGQCVNLGGSGKIGTWKLQSGGTLELAINNGYEPLKLQIDRNGLITGKRGTQVIMGSVYGPVKDWPDAIRANR